MDILKVSQSLKTMSRKKTTCYEPQAVIFRGMRTKLTLKPYNAGDYYSGKWKPSWHQKIPSGNDSCPRKEKMVKWVFQTLAKDHDWESKTCLYFIFGKRCPARLHSWSIVLNCIPWWFVISNKTFKHTALYICAIKT